MRGECLRYQAGDVITKVRETLVRRPAFDGHVTIVARRSGRLLSGLRSPQEVSERAKRASGRRAVEFPAIEHLERLARAPSRETPGLALHQLIELFARQHFDRLGCVLAAALRFVSR